jgi:hypothetical protein
MIGFDSGGFGGGTELFKLEGEEPARVATGMDWRFFGRLIVEP